jgi:hypothetical protein
MREIVHIQAGQCGNQIGAKVSMKIRPRMVEIRRERLIFVGDRAVRPVLERLPS